MDAPPINQKHAVIIWDILMECAGATEHWRENFLQTTTTEYRFQGSLGFGGKFWNCNGKWYINCYPEDETPERLATIENVNQRLAALKFAIQGKT